MKNKYVDKNNIKETLSEISLENPKVISIDLSTAVIDGLDEKSEGELESIIHLFQKNHEVKIIKDVDSIKFGNGDQILFGIEDIYFFYKFIIILDEHSKSISNFFMTTFN